MPEATVLVVDDEENLRYLLDVALRHLDFRVLVAANGRDALTTIANERPDAVILDVMLPDLDGFEVVRRLRADGDHTPVLFLTAKDATEDKVRGLTLGGDDYVHKPFSLEEVVARLRALLRRAGLAPAPARVRCGEIELDDDAHVVTTHGQEVTLSPTEFKLLRFLLANQGRVLSKSQILDHVWEYDFGGDGGVVETYVSYLRRKLDVNSGPSCIQTVRGVGYSMRPR